MVQLTATWRFEDDVIAQVVVHPAAVFHRLQIIVCRYIHQEGKIGEVGINLGVIHGYLLAVLIVEAVLPAARVITHNREGSRIYLIVVLVLDPVGGAYGVGDADLVNIAVKSLTCSIIGRTDIKRIVVFNRA